MTDATTASDTPDTPDSTASSKAEGTTKKVAKKTASKTTRKAAAKKTAKKTASKTASKTTKKAAAKKTASKTSKKAAAKKTAKKAAAKKTASKTTKKAATKKSTRKVAGTGDEGTTPEVGAELETETTPVETAAAAPEDTGEPTAAPTASGSDPDSEPASDSDDSEAPRKKRRRRGGRGRKGESAEAEGKDAADTDTETDAEDGNDGDESTAKSSTTKKKPRRDRRWPDRLSIEVTPTGPRAEKGSRLMLVDDVPGESCRIAILEQGRLEELFVERAQSSTAVGNIYKARVVNVESAIQAAFVDYGEGMNGFLHVSDLHPRYFPGGDKTEKVGRKTPRRERPPIQDALKKGQEILVQVLKQGVGTKGPTVTSYLSIPGRLMVMMPGMDRVGVSRKVDDDQRDRMRKILDQLDLPEGFGFILRTAGYDRTKAELKRDVAYLRRLWEQLEKRMDRVGAPSELYTEGDLLVRTIRDVVDDSIGSIVVNSETGFERARTFLEVIAPKSTQIVRHYDDATPLFDAFGVERQIDMIHAREVPLRSGGALVIDQTEAMVAIDVNSGRSRGAKDAESNAVSTNREAVDEIARQLRLRDQGGLVVCDLIDMRFARNRKEIEERLAANLGRDRARTTFLPISEFGLVEMTRQRIRPSIRSQYFSPCPSCQGLGEIRNADSVAADAVRRAARFLAIDKVHRVELVCGSRVASAILSGHRRRIDALERESGGRVDVRISDQIPSDRFDVYAYDDRNADLDLGRLPKIQTPDPESLPTEVLEPDEDDTGTSSGGGRRRRRRRRKPAPADVVSIAMAGGFEEFDEDDDEPIDTGDSNDDAEASNDDGEGGGRRKRRRRRRRRGRGGDAEATPEPVPAPEPIRVHELAKALDIKSREILDAVAERLESLELKGAMSWIPAEHVAEVRGFFVTEEPVAPEAPTDETPASDAEAEGTSEHDEDGEPRKKRRRRRRGGRRRRRGGSEDGDSSESSSGDAGTDVAAEGDAQGEARRKDGDDHADDEATDGDSPTAESAAFEDDEAVSESAVIEGSESETPPAIVETTKPKPRKPRRSLYGGRFQRLGGPPAIDDR